MSHTLLLKKLTKATRKRDKWARKVESLKLDLDREMPVTTSVTVESSPITAPSAALPALTEAELRLFHAGERYQGLAREVGKAIGRSAMHVLRVARGLSIEASTLSSLRTAMRVRDSAPDTFTSPLTLDQQKGIARDGLYFGLYTTVGRALGINPSFVGRVASGRAKSARVLSAIRAELARLDSEYASAKGADIG